jgi:peptidoglycan-associated lipoprotein
MRRVLTVALPLLALALAGCPKKPTGGNCESDKDCAAQEGFGKVCVTGHCQECAKDADCPAGFACKENKCAPRVECDETHPCSGGRACEAGRCAAAAAVPQGPASVESQPAAPVCQLQRVQFGFDEATLATEARDVLAKDADCLKQMKAKKVTIEGHCDERGTSEYNQHLGQRRAESVRKYLTNLGLDAKSLDPVSFGKEQPLCTQSTEDCWQQNRRAELKAQ